MDNEFKRKVQSVVDIARRQNIVRATETYKETYKRILAALMAAAERSS